MMTGGDAEDDAEDVAHDSCCMVGVVCITMTMTRL